MITPRPDQQHSPHRSGTAGSRSGSQDTAAALGYPGVPPGVINCQAAVLLQQGVGQPHFYTFTGAGRIWTVVLSFVVTANASFSLATYRSYAAIQTALSGLTLAAVNLGVAGPSQAANGQSEPPLNGLPVVQGESLILNVNGGTVIPQLDQTASAVVLYSIP